MLAFLASLAFASPEIAPPPAPDAAYDVVYLAGAELHWVAPWYDWNTLRWVEGYWRPASQPGQVWVEGGYDSWGIYQPGRWIMAPTYVAPTYIAVPIYVPTYVSTRVVSRPTPRRPARRVRR